MLNSLSTLLYRIASWKTLLVAIVLYIPFPAYLLKNLEIQMNALARKEIGPIDLLFEYNPAKISRMVADYGPEGRAIYAQGALIVDTAYPIIYTFLFCIILSLLFRNRTYAPFRLVNVVPVGILILDLLENACIVYLLKTFPNTSMAIASLCSILTNLKWAVTAVFLGLVVYGLIRLAMGGRQKQLGQV